MKIKKWVHASIAILLSAQSLSCFASCDVGAVVFKDTLYGTAIGGGVGALILITNTGAGPQNIAPVIGTSALMGAAVGALVGVVELNLTCGHGRNDASSGRLFAHPVVTNNLGAGLGLTYDL